MKLAIHKLKAAKGSRHAAKKRGRGNASGHEIIPVMAVKGKPLVLVAVEV